MDRFVNQTNASAMPAEPYERRLLPMVVGGWEENC